MMDRYKKDGIYTIALALINGAVIETQMLGKDITQLIFKIQGLNNRNPTVVELKSIHTDNRDSEISVNLTLISHYTIRPTDEKGKVIKLDHNLVLPN